MTLFIAMQDFKNFKPKCAVESDSLRHLVSAERNCADPLNHEQSPSASFRKLLFSCDDRPKENRW
jgi:hypothetical protein